MASKKYLVKLYPHDKFFFGGENTFEDGNQANYLVKSNYFPQQTGVLGFVRHQLLLQCNDDSIFKDNKIQDRTKAGELIGEKSFDVNGKFDFGTIKSLSPVFIVKNNIYLLPGNKEYQIYTKMEDDCSEKKVNIFLELEQKDDNFLLKDYEAKFPIPDLLMDKCGSKIKYENVFKEHKQVGIRKNYEGGTDDEAYYVQTFYKFKDGYGFAFIVELDENVKFNSQNIVSFGGEQQTFRMEVTEFGDDLDNLIPEYEPSENFDKLVLVSDAYVEKDITGLYDFAITETKDFRFFITETVKHGNYYKKHKKTRKYNLYKKGSVFYGGQEQIESLKEEFEIKHFQDLGYNQYKLINKKQ